MCDLQINTPCQFDIIRVKGDLSINTELIQMLQIAIAYKKAVEGSATLDKTVDIFVEAPG